MVVVGLLMWLAAAGANQLSREAAPDTAPTRIVWVPMAGPNGGGGGRRVPARPQPRPDPPQAAGTPDATTPVSVITPLQPEQVQDTAEPQPLLLINTADISMAGAANAPSVIAGGGVGQGSGPGNGDGAGPGDDRGFGDGAYRPGNGVTPPVPMRRAAPRYTADAMRARAHGIITVECVVEPSGECGDARIVRMFAPPYGLDREALDTARRWLFRPGTRGGEPVPVLVSFEIAFNIH